MKRDNPGDWPDVRMVNSRFSSNILVTVMIPTGGADADAEYVKPIFSDQYLTRFKLFREYPERFCSVTGCFLNSVV